jgi:hypothetical protein
MAGEAIVVLDRDKDFVKQAKKESSSSSCLYHQSEK